MNGSRRRAAGRKVESCSSWGLGKLFVSDSNLNGFWRTKGGGKSLFEKSLVLEFGGHTELIGLNGVLECPSREALESPGSIECSKGSRKVRLERFGPLRLTGAVLVARA